MFVRAGVIFTLIKCKNIGVIGATSPVGKSIVKHLLDDYSLTITYRNISFIPQQFLNHPDIKCVYVDLTSITPFDKKEFQHCHTIIWVAHILQSDEKEIILNEQAIQSFFSILPDTSIERIIYISSGGSIYGKPLILPIPESHQLNPISSYGKAKKKIEQLLIQLHEQTETALAILRPSNIYGPESLTGRSKGIISSYIQSIIYHKPFTIIGNKNAIRDFLHIDDFTKAVQYTLNSQENKIIWNVGTEIGYSVIHVMGLISKYLKKTPPQINQSIEKNSVILVNILSNKKIMSESNWMFSVSLETGIQRLIEQLVLKEKGNCL